MGKVGQAQYLVAARAPAKKSSVIAEVVT